VIGALVVGKVVVMALIETDLGAMAMEETNYFGQPAAVKRRARSQAALARGNPVRFPHSD